MSKILTTTTKHDNLHLHQKLHGSFSILFNGGIKDASSAQKSKNLSMKLYEAQTFVTKIEEALHAQMIIITDDKRYLKSFDGTTELIL